MAREKYLVFARKWRPQSFEDVVGQEHITRTLQNSLGSGRIAHAFLFIGSRGIGKTTTARVLAKALNCLSVDAPTATPCGECDNCRSIAEGNSMDVIEIDGASNNGVDDIREIRDNIRMVPSRSRYKIYIIDEVHQLSAGAFNALLKTLEEPPAHAVFILATTEAHKVPATIISRCQRFDFRRVSVDKICVLLRVILDTENVKCSEEALAAIARAAEGGIRDAESILDQLVSYCGDEIAFKDVFDVLGLVDWRLLHELCDAITDQDIGRQLTLVADVVDAGKDLSQFVTDILRYFRNLLVCKTENAQALLALPENEFALMRAHADRFTLTQIIRLVEQFAELTKGFDSQFAQRIALESLLIKLSKRSVEMSVDAVVEKIMQLGEHLTGGAVFEGGPQSDPPGGHCPAAEPVVARERPMVDEQVPVTERNMADMWRRVAAEAAQGDPALAAAVAHATPVGIHDDALILHFTLRTSKSLNLIERSENRGRIERAFRAMTSNIGTFQCEIAEEKTEETAGAAAGAVAGAGAVAEKSNVKPALGVSRARAEEIDAALEDPHVARVVDMFKGKVVDIKQNPRHEHHE